MAFMNSIPAYTKRVYETIEIHRNVTVEILRCKNCGNTEILWFRQENTEDEWVGDENENRTD